MKHTLSWDDLKALANTANLSYHYIDRGIDYKVWINDGADKYITLVTKEDPATTEQTDFETNYKAGANKRSSIQVTPFSANKVEFSGRGCQGTATKSTTTDIDFLVSEALLINGGMVYFANAVVGDTFTCQVVDKDSVYYPAGTVLNEWITSWNVMPEHPTDLTTPQAGSIPAGVYLRLKYTSTGTVTDVTVLLNYKLNKKLSPGG